MKTERLKYFEEQNLLNKTFIMSADYIKNGYNGPELSTVLLEDIMLENIPDSIIDHLWVKDEKNIKATKIWKSKQHSRVHFRARLIKISKPMSLYENKEDINIIIKEIIC